MATDNFMHNSSETIPDLDQQRLRSGESNITHLRRNRFFCNDQGWFYTTREGIRMGPFVDWDETLLSLLYFLERCQWSDLEHLHAYMDQRCFEHDTAVTLQSIIGSCA